MRIIGGLLDDAGWEQERRNMSSFCNSPPFSLLLSQWKKQRETHTFVFDSRFMFVVRKLFSNPYQ